MRIHQEGRNIILWATVIYVIALLPALFFIQHNYWYFHLIALTSAYILIIRFFRNPLRELSPDEDIIYAPADGKVVEIVPQTEDEYFNEPMIRISIFMSIYNVHLNRIPVSGKLIYHKYHPGKYLVAFHPKSSSLNENWAYGIRTHKNQNIFLRQIAGFVARRIRSYVKENQMLKQGDELGFIRFGSRVDIFVPENVTIRVQKGQKVWANKSILGYF